MAVLIVKNCTYTLKIATQEQLDDAAKGWKPMFHHNSLLGEASCRLCDLERGECENLCCTLCKLEGFGRKRIAKAYIKKGEKQNYLRAITNHRK